MADSASWQAWGWLVARTTFIPHLDVMPQNPTIKNLLMKNEKTKRKRSGFKSEGSSSSNELETQNHATHRSGSLSLSLSLKFLHVHTLVGWCEAPPTKGEGRVKYYHTTTCTPHIRQICFYWAQDFMWGASDSDQRTITCDVIPQ